MILIITLIIICWLIMSVIAYFMTRWSIKLEFNTWTLGDRWINIFMSIGLGPIMILVSLFFATIHFATIYIDWSQKVKW